MDKQAYEELQGSIRRELVGGTGAGAIIDALVESGWFDREHAMALVDKIRRSCAAEIERAQQPAYGDQMAYIDHLDRMEYLRRRQNDEAAMVARIAVKGVLGLLGLAID